MFIGRIKHMVVACGVTEYGVPLEPRLRLAYLSSRKHCQVGRRTGPNCVGSFTTFVQVFIAASAEAFHRVGRLLVCDLYEPDRGLH